MDKVNKVPDWMFAFIGAMLLITVWIAVNDRAGGVSASFAENTAEAGQIVERETEAEKEAYFVSERPFVRRAIVKEEPETEPETVPETAAAAETVTDPEEDPEEELQEPETETVVTEIACDTEPETEAYHPLYAVDGEVMDEDLQRFLWEELKIEGIEWWMPYAMLTAYQESSFDVYDITNGRDYGIYQFYIEDWDEKCARYGYPGADVFNPYVQIIVYVKQTANRLKNLGCSIEDTISRHMMSDWCGYNAKYVSDVLGHTIEKIR